MRTRTALTLAVLLATAGMPAHASAGAGTISGRVTSAGAGEPLETICVDIVGPTRLTVHTAADGGYAARSLPDGEYSVGFRDCVNRHFRTRWWRDAPDRASSDPVMVVAGAHVASVDAELAVYEPPMATRSVADGETPESMADFLSGRGVEVSNVGYSGAPVAVGTFRGGAGIVGFAEGVVLSTGTIADVVEQNHSDGMSTAHGTPGDPALDTMSADPTSDAAVIEFDFVPDADQIVIRYVFASDEYNEYVGSTFNDVFAFHVNGTNCAVVPDSRQVVSVNTINGGNPYGAANASNAALFRNNDVSDAGGRYDTALDGLTTVLTCTASVTPGESNHLRLAIADVGDRLIDSAVFIERDSFSTCAESGLASSYVHRFAEPIVAGRDPALARSVHDANCDHVVGAENRIEQSGS